MSTLSFLHGIDTIEVNDGARPIQTAKSSVIGLIGTAGKGPVNTPVLITGNRRDAAAIFGAYTSDPFSIPKALEAIFKQGGATVVVINVCDPTTHLSASTVTDSVVLAGNSGSVTRGFISNVTLGTAFSAPYTIASYGTNKAFTAAADNGSGKVRLTVASGVGTPYVVGEPISVVTSSVSGYIVSTTVLAKSSTTIDINIAYTANATGTISPPAIERIALPAGATLSNVYDIETGTLQQNPADLILGERVLVTYDVSSTTVNVDYFINAETGAVTRNTAGSKILPNATFNVTYKYVNPALVTDNQVIGTTLGDGTRTGIQALNRAKSELSVEPRLIAAPGYTFVKPDAVTRNAVTVALVEMANKLRAIAFASTTNATKESATAYASDFVEPRLGLCYPSINYTKPGADGQLDPVPLDIIAAGITSAVDNDSSGGFWNSPSNHLIQGAISLTKPVDFSLSDTESTANYLNSRFVITAVREQGFRLWGNRLSDGGFMVTRRVADLIEDSIALAHIYAVDRNITKGYVQSLLANVNAYIRTLEASGAILGGKAWFDKTINTPTQIASGKLTIDFDFTPAVPAERITFRAHIVEDYISRIFDAN